MILEGFEIENWTCIRRACVSRLPPTGVIVLHGPNGTGKSSMIEALRACLMDNKSTSKALDRAFSKNSTEKPRVSVTFRARGTSWRITKQFNSKESRLESRTAAGQWKLETADPSEAHERTRLLSGGADSTEGLHQLLWLTQAEFRLPDPKKFDADVQANLRAVLGVLQTSLDDRFLGRVKKEWSRWFAARSKPGETPRVKKDCPLDKAQAELKQLGVELTEAEAAFREHEKMIERSRELEMLSRQWRRQLEQKTSARDTLQLEYERSLTRIEGYRRACERVAAAEKSLADAEAHAAQRTETEQQIREARQAAEVAHRGLEEATARLHGAEQNLRDLRRQAQNLVIRGRELQRLRDGVHERRQLLTLKQRVNMAVGNLERAEQTAAELEDLRKQAGDRPAPDASLLSELEQNRGQAATARAELEACGISVTLVPEPGAPAARLATDGASSVEAAGNGSAQRYAIRRRAEILIPGWGRAEIARGSDARGIDQIEQELRDLDGEFAVGLARFGIAPSDPTALQQLYGLIAAQRLREPLAATKLKDLQKLAPNGLDALRQEVSGLRNRCAAAEAELTLKSFGNGVTDDDLDRQTERLDADLAAHEAESAALQRQIDNVECAIDGAHQERSALGSNAIQNSKLLGLRRQKETVNERLQTLNATVETLRLHLERGPTAELIEEALRDAQQSLAEARAGLEAATLTEGEETLRERLDAANDARRALQEQLAQADREYHQIEGALRLTEGLHSRRAALAARVEGLKRYAERETLESQAYDRLYALFEECREKQLGAVMKPIHDRVLRWMKLLRIGNYQSLRFNDQFLPEGLVATDGATELLLGEESTGTIEQIALMVRLALGATLSTPEEPVVAVLDDPLTHSDSVRLDSMRAVLKNAAAGDASVTPPAGPLQVVVFTCHPEWFDVPEATRVDLSRADVLTRRC